jgi:hypothetical protein
MKLYLKLSKTQKIDPKHSADIEISFLSILCQNPFGANKK